MIQEIQRLKAMGLSNRKIAKALDCSRNTVEKYLSTGGDAASAAAVDYRAPWSEAVDWKAAHAATSAGAPLSEYWEEKIKPSEALGGVPYVSFWREYRRRFPNIPLDFHKLHPPGERCEVDYKGDSPGLGYVDRRTGEYVPCRLFGAVLPFSQLFFPRATLSEKQGDVLRSIGEAFTYFGGVAMTTAVDNAKAQVKRAHRYDPDVQREFAHFCEHYGTAPLAMRPGKPKDKNLIENSLGVFWRWARRRIKVRTFYSLGDLNEFLNVLTGEFNGRVQRKYGMSRREKFTAGEASKLLPLPEGLYNYGEWKRAKPHPDCHVQVGKNFYSVPYQLRGKEVDVRLTSALVEIFSGLECVARHIRAHPNTMGKYLSKDAHLPEAHRALKEATPQRMLEDAAKVGPQTETVVRLLIEEARHPLMYLRRVQGILRLSKRHTPADLERAASTLVKIGARCPRLDDVEALIKTQVTAVGAAVIPIKRQANPYLRGQESWRPSPKEETK